MAKDGKKNENGRLLVHGVVIRASKGVIAVLDAFLRQINCELIAEKTCSSNLYLVMEK